MDNTFTRDPDEYRPSVHAKQRQRERDVDWDAVAQTIVNGTVEERIEDESHDNYGIRLRDTWLFTEYEIVILPPSWIDESTGIIKSCWILAT